MQRHKSVEKRNRTSKKANLSNRIDRSKLKTAIKHVVEAKDKSSAQTALNNAVSILDKIVKSGLIHQNKAANNKSRLYSVVQKIEK
jgi:small subunit ribosomal protein S20